MVQATQIDYIYIYNINITYITNQYKTLGRIRSGKCAVDSDSHAPWARQPQPLSRSSGSGMLLGTYRPPRRLRYLMNFSWDQNSDSLICRWQWSAMKQMFSDPFHLDLTLPGKIWSNCAGNRCLSWFAHCWCVSVMFKYMVDLKRDHFRFPVAGVWMIKRASMFGCLVPDNSLFSMQTR